MSCKQSVVLAPLKDSVNTRLFSEISVIWELRKFLRSVLFFPSGVCMVVLIKHTEFTDFFLFSLKVCLKK